MSDAAESKPATFSLVTRYTSSSGSTGEPSMAAQLVSFLHTEHNLARKPNYGFEKRRKEMEKKSKKEAKRQRKLEKNPDRPENSPPLPSDSAHTESD